MKNTLLNGSQEYFPAIRDPRYSSVVIKKAAFAAFFMTGVDKL